MRFISNLRFILFLLLSMIVAINSVEAKKVRQNLKIVKSSNKDRNNSQEKTDNSIRLINPSDSLIFIGDHTENQFLDPKLVSFAGYEKEANSSKETFIIINNSDADLAGCEIEIIYKDMKGRMLHKRCYEINIDIPAKENRKVDIPSWDTQKTYYYYLGNEPKKVATPYSVEIKVLSFLLVP